MARLGRSICLMLLGTIILSGCSTVFGPQITDSMPDAVGPATTTPFQPLQPGTEIEPGDLRATLAQGSPMPPAVTSMPSPSPSTTQAGWDLAHGSVTVWLDPALPSKLRQAISFPPGIEQVSTSENADLRLEIDPSTPQSYWVYALVAPFPTITDSITSDELRQIWRGESSGSFVGVTLLVDGDTLASLSAYWGAPATSTVKNVAAKQLLDQAWGDGESWAIVPFEKLEPRWKVLQVDGISPLRRDFTPEGYPLAVPISLLGRPESAVTYRQTWVLPSNRNPERMTVLAMTGVTALVRATAYAMEQKGLLYPARDIGRLLREADLVHISNEVPFAVNCSFPNPVQKDVRFCSDTRYIKLLESISTDIVELTGDHLQDWGAGAVQHTLEMYRQRGWVYYGGGANINEARQSVSVEHNDNRLAFIGCNAKGLASAGARQPGAAPCDFDWMSAHIKGLHSDGYLPIATFQHYEYYTYPPQGNQRRDFQRMARAGAVIVSGSQAHQPQAFAFHAQALIHYGLGNLFFDQYDVSLATRQGFIDRHIFYEGRYISTELLTHLFVDYARARPMTTKERENLLKKVFKASGW